MVTRTHGKQRPPSRRRFTDRIDARSIQPNPCVVPDVVFSLVTPSNNTAASHDEDKGEMERNTTWLEHSHMPDGNVSRCNRAWLQGRQQRRKPARHPVLRSRYPLLLALVGAYEESNAAERARESSSTSTDSSRWRIQKERRNGCDRPWTVYPDKLRPRGNAAGERAPRERECGGKYTHGTSTPVHECGCGYECGVLRPRRGTGGTDAARIL